MSPLEIVFWLSLCAVGYVYAGYPALLFLWSRARPRPVSRGIPTPSVSIVMAVHDERQHIEQKLDDCLALDYPEDWLEIVISLDGPTDGTDEVVRRREGGRLRVVHARRHEGKAAALNRGMAEARGDVVVFCDARQRLPRGALRELLAAFHDPDVGAVSGDLVLQGGDGDAATGGVSAYWRYEKAIRGLESRVHSTVGATGAFYAVRRELLRPLPHGAVLDDVIVPMRVVMSGKRTVHEPRATVYDRPHPPELEYQRKVRTLAGNYQLLFLMPALLIPTRNPLFLQLVSHKLGRLLVPYLLIVLLASNLWLPGGVYRALLAFQTTFYLLAVAGALAQRAPLAAAHPGGAVRHAAGRLVALPYTFVLLNWAAVVALGSFLSGKASWGRWEAPRRLTRHQDVTAP